VFGSLSDTAISPIDATGTWWSVIGNQFSPPSVVRNTPPLATPM
jgi:hypothetical protein